MSALMSKKGQVAIFVIIALVIVGGIVVFFTFREQLFGPSIPAELKPAFDYYEQCIEYEIEGAIELAGSQGGHVYPAEYIPGSEYAPFSSQLNFLGFPVPYWFYLSGNGVVKEQVPTRAEIQEGVAKYVEEKVNRECNFNDFYEQGFSVNLSTSKATAKISDGSVDVDVSAEMIVSKGESSARKTSHSASVKSKLGKLFKSAMSIYERQRNEAFLENYSADVLRLYAPVDGVEISCSGRIWKTREVVDGLKDALQANVAAIRFEGDYYVTTNEENKYYVIDLPVDEQVNLIYSKTWPTKIEVFGATDELMVAEPVGTQPGMAAMGFCYAPYHFVYDISFPVMIQVLEGQEIFQFPVVVIIDKNMPRQAMLSELPAEEEETDICQFNTQDIKVSVYDSNLNKVDADLTYNCFTQQCELGSTTDGTFAGKAPACVNGYIRARAEGYSQKSQLFSTNKESSIDLILDKEYEVKLNLEVGGLPLDGTAIIVFQSSDKTISTALPDDENIMLSEGLYNVTVYAYGSSTLTIPASTKTQCHEVSSGGFLGAWFGATREECIDVTIPETKLESALIGGGRSEIYILPSDLQKGVLNLQVDALPKPNSLAELQNNFESFDAMGVALSI